MALQLKVTAGNQAGHVSWKLKEIEKKGQNPAFGVGVLNLPKKQSTSYAFILYGERGGPKSSHTGEKDLFHAEIVMQRVFFFFRGEGFAASLMVGRSLLSRTKRAFVQRA